VPGLGHAFGSGEIAYLERINGQSPTTPRKLPSREAQTPRSGALPSSKRRKIEQASSPQVIDLVDDDDVQEVPSCPTPATPAAHQYDRPRSSHSSRSRYSIDSGPILTGSQSVSRPRSEFQLTESRIKAGRGKGKNRAKQQNPGTQHSNFDRSVSGSITPRPQETSTIVANDTSVMKSESARKAILQSLQQGLDQHATTSRHFSNARINESNDGVNDRTKNAQHANSHNKNNNLRAFRRASLEVMEAESYSDDELSMDLPQNKTASIALQPSPSKKSPAAKSGAKRRSKIDEITRVWPLNFARTHDFESQGVAEPVRGKPVLQLKPGTETNTWRIVEYDDASDNFLTKACIAPKHVIKVVADDVSHMRLEGPRQQDGNRSIIDLEFQDTEAFRKFRDSHAASLSRNQKVIIWEDKSMESLFRKPLPRNDKVGASPPVHSSLLTSDNQDITDARSTKSPLWTQMRTATQGSNSTQATNEKDGLTSTTRRPVRSTRSTAPTHEMDDDSPHKEVEKYSVKHGLGSPWLKALTYGEGRQRAAIYFDDLPRLDEEEFLNDSLIDFYMIYLFHQSKIPKDKVFFFNTFFFSTLTKNTGRDTMNYKAVEKWTSKVDVFGYDYIVVPINEDTHWYLAIICNVGNIDRKPVQEDNGDSALGGLADGGDGVAENVVPTEAETPMEPQLVNSSRTLTPPHNLSNQQHDDDINLFDEASKLDLIDRDVTGTEGEERRVASHGSSVPQSPQGDAVHVAESVTDREAAPKTVLSNLNASPEKKKSKRRWMVPRKDPNQPIIIILDSLSQTRSPTVRALKDWLAAEGEAKRGMEVTIKEKGFYPKSEQIPTQSNFTDCGVYLLGYAEKFFQDPDEFKRKLLTGDMTAAEDWPELKPKEMRNNLRDILFTLAKEQKLTEPTRKKGKKSITGNKSSPSRAEAKSSKPKSQLVINNESETTKPDGPNISQVKSASSVRVQDQQPSELSIPPLGSPFKPTPQLEKPIPGADSPTVGKVSDSPPVMPAVLPPHTKQTQERRTHSEVRIPVQTPSSRQPGKIHIAEVEPTDMNELQRGMGSSSGSLSPHKKSRPIVDDDEEVRARLEKKQETISLSAEREPSVRTSRVLSQPREGNSDHPIEIMDSQELTPMVMQPARRLDASSPIQREQASKPPHIAQTLRPALPSVEETLSFSPRGASRKHYPPEEKVGHLLEARLDAEDEARDMLKGPEMRSMISEAAPTISGPAEESVSDVMDVDSQGADLMDTAEDDGIVGETPEARRRSPPAGAM
jgi:sentrin-specific protease 7